MKTKLASFNDFISSLKQRDISTWLDKFTFSKILLLWLSGIFGFGVFYFLGSTQNSFLLSTGAGKPVSQWLDYVYFSFITATSTGFGDIVPIGMFKSVAILEIIFGLIVLALVTSKLVSLKQDVIITEIYDISFTEKINRLRSSMLLFRQNITRIITRIEEKTITSNEICHMYIDLSSFEATLHEVHSFFKRRTRHYFTKKIDPINTELIFNSVLQSFQKIDEILSELNEKKLKWKREITLRTINKCLKTNKLLLECLEKTKNIPKDYVDGYTSDSKDTIKSIKKKLQ